MTTDLFETSEFSDLDSWLREDTGKTLTDSGDYYRRIYDKAPDDFTICFSSDEGEFIPVISTKYFVEQLFYYLPNLQKEFDAYAEKSDELWQDDLDKFMKSKGYKQVAKDNTCNHESDLSQDFVFIIYVPDDFDSENDSFYYCEDAIVALRFHTGCDIRSGYSRPLLVKGNGYSSYSFPADFTAKFWDEDGFSDDLSDGNNPGYQLNKSIEEKGWKVIERSDSTVVVEAKGERHELSLSVL